QTNEYNTRLEQIMFSSRSKVHNPVRDGTRISMDRLWARGVKKVNDCAQPKRQRSNWSGSSNLTVSSCIFGPVTAARSAAGSGKWALSAGLSSGAETTSAVAEFMILAGRNY